MKCPACNADVPPAEVRRKLSLARCPRCQVSIDLTVRGDDITVTGFHEPSFEGLTIDIDDAPEKKDTYRDARASAGRFHARLNWRYKGLGISTLFALGWNLFLGFLVFVIVSARPEDTSGSMLCGGLALSGLAAIGLAGVWHVLSAWFNQTHIKVEDHRLRCCHRPFPVRRETPDCVLDEVEMFVVEAGVDQGDEPNTPIHWRIDARMKSGVTLPVVTHLRSEATTRFIARRLEAQL